MKKRKSSASGQQAVRGAPESGNLVGQMGSKLGFHRWIVHQLLLPRLIISMLEVAFFTCVKPVGGRRPRRGVRQAKRRGQIRSSPNP